MWHLSGRRFRADLLQHGFTGSTPLCCIRTARARGNLKGRGPGSTVAAAADFPRGVSHCRCGGSPTTPVSYTDRPPWRVRGCGYSVSRFL